LNADSANSDPTKRHSSHRLQNEKYAVRFNQQPLLLVRENVTKTFPHMLQYRGGGSIGAIKSEWLCEIFRHQFLCESFWTCENHKVTTLFSQSTPLYALPAGHVRAPLGLFGHRSYSRNSLPDRLRDPTLSSDGFGENYL